MLPLDLPLTAWAPLAFVVYGLLALVFGEVFPLSRYGMYASAVARSEGAIPVFLAAGVEAPIGRFVGFDGLQTQDVVSHPSPPAASRETPPVAVARRRPGLCPIPGPWCVPDVLQTSAYQ